VQFLLLFRSLKSWKRKFLIKCEWNMEKKIQKSKIVWYLKFRVCFKVDNDLVAMGKSQMYSQYSYFVLDAMPDCLSVCSTYLHFIVIVIALSTTCCTSCCAASPTLPEPEPEPYPMQSNWMTDILHRYPAHPVCISLLSSLYLSLSPTSLSVSSSSLVSRLIKYQPHCWWSVIFIGLQQHTEYCTNWMLDSFVVLSWLSPSLSLSPSFFHYVFFLYVFLFLFSSLVVFYYYNCLLSVAGYWASLK